ncbi:hypothetical protein AB4Y40_23960 [Paraburkholderia sp. EG287B]|uniref:hypothetical protein n=1 Tax=Paraburkholderia sp. EG287B TaxID=3237010 RepID=UPI0034D37C9C
MLKANPTCLDHDWVEHMQTIRAWGAATASVAQARIAMRLLLYGFGKRTGGRVLAVG